ncbi:hypothetical protein V5O48_017750 [Marasmius crinis-equi]|uniref:Uncharacterized protein n=1 Tax=Marasmius crinis-equi TaxID=585013 RepID=A0ABR3EN54_9AGAR
MTIQTRSRGTNDIPWPPPSPPGRRLRRDVTSNAPSSGPPNTTSDVTPVPSEDLPDVDGNSSVNEHVYSHPDEHREHVLSGDTAAWAQLEGLFITYSPLSSPPSSPSLAIESPNCPSEHEVQQEPQNIPTGQADNSPEERSQELGPPVPMADVQIEQTQTGEMAAPMGGVSDREVEDALESVEMIERNVEMVVEVMVSDPARGDIVPNEYAILPDWILAMLEDRESRKSALVRFLDPLPISRPAPTSMRTLPMPDSGVDVFNSCNANIEPLASTQTAPPLASTPVPAPPIPGILASPALFLAQAFPDQALEVLALTDARTSGVATTHLAAYRWFRSYHILYTVSEEFEISLTNRANTTAKEIAPGLLLSVSDIFDWVGVAPRTFANYKSRLEHTYGLIMALRSRVEQGPVDDLLRAKYREQWRPYLVSYNEWLRQPQQSYPLSLRWSIDNMAAAASQTLDLM